MNSRGKTRAQIAALVDITAQDLGAYERGTRRLSLAMAETIAEALGLPRTAFLTPLTTTRTKKKRGRPRRRP